MNSDLFEPPIARTFGRLMRDGESDPIQMLRMAIDVHEMKGRGNFFHRNRRAILEGLFACDLSPSKARGHLLKLPDGRAWTILDDLHTWKAATVAGARDNGTSLETLLSHVRATRPGGPVFGLEFAFLLGLAVLAANEGDDK
jgi:hypothetical protein